MNSYVNVERWLGSSTFAQSRAWREPDDTLHVQSLGAGGYITVIAAGDWISASTGPATGREYLTATTPTRGPVLI